MTERADRNGTSDDASFSQARHRGVELVVGVLLVVTIAAAVGLAVVYVLGGNVQLEGALLGVALLSVAVATGMWAGHFMPQGPHTEDRPVLESSAGQRADVAADFDRGERTVLRRRVLASLLATAFAALGAAALFPLRSLGPFPLPDLRRTAWSRGKRLVDESGVPVRPDRLDVDSVLTVFPEGASEQEREYSQTVLIRLGPGILPDRDDRNGAPPGYLAFSKVCTHAGCPVGLYQAETHQLVCPCHQSLFDVTAGAAPVFGPATRSLPALPIAVEDGFLVATDGYPEPVGPAFWDFGAENASGDGG